MLIHNIFLILFNSCRFLDEKEKNLEEAKNHIQVLKRDLAGKDAEVGFSHHDYLYLLD